MKWAVVVAIAGPRTRRRNDGHPPGARDGVENALIDA